VDRRIETLVVVPEAELHAQLTETLNQQQILHRVCMSWDEAKLAWSAATRSILIISAQVLSSSPQEWLEAAALQRDCHACLVLASPEDFSVLSRAFVNGQLEWLRLPMSAAELTLRIRREEHRIERLAADSKFSQLEQDRLQDREKQALIAELAGSAAHELNQPLTSVLGYAELLRRRCQYDYDLKAIQTIINEAERMATIVRKLANITKYETKTYVGDQRILDLDQASESTD